MTSRGNYGEGRDGSASPENTNGEGSQDNTKKKRPRVGEIRKSFGGNTGGDNSNSDRNPYRPNSGYNQQNNNRSYNNNSSSNNRSYNRSESTERRSYNSDNSERRSYNNDNNDRSYNNSDRSYNNSNSNSNRSYGSNNNSNRSYNNSGSNNLSRSYGNNSNNERSYNNTGGGGYSNNRGNSNSRPSYGNNDRYNNNNNDRYNNNNNNNRSYGNNGGGNERYTNSENRRPFRPENTGPKRIVKPVKYKENIDPDTPIRLNKYLANAGVCSRREADSYITAGVVKVNGEVVNELGVKVKRGDLVAFHDQPVRLESKVYVLLNKPKNCVTTSDDPENRMTVMDLVKTACPERIYPVGRLDRNTTGVLLLTNDGDLASKLTHPKFKKKKIYQVTLDRDVAIEDMQAIADGVELDDGEIHADSIAYQAEDVLDVVGIEIHSGRNRIVRRIFEKLGYQVMKLDRVYFAGLTKKNVTRGKWRYLSEKEVNMLRMGAFE